MSSGSQQPSWPAGLSRREYLYLLNITALAALHSGDPDLALTLEQRIADALDQRAEPGLPAALCQ